MLGRGSVSPLLRGMLAAAVVVTAGCGGTVEIPGARNDEPVVEWATYGQSQSRSFFNAHETWITRDSVARMRPKWLYRTGAIVTASPTVAYVDVPAEGRIKVVFIPSWDGNLYALRAA